MMLARLLCDKSVTTDLNTAAFLAICCNSRPPAVAMMDVSQDSEGVV